MVREVDEGSVMLLLSAWQVSVAPCSVREATTLILLSTPSALMLATCVMRKCRKENRTKIEERKKSIRWIDDGGKVGYDKGSREEWKVMKTGREKM